MGKQTTKRVSLREAADILRRQGVKIKWVDCTIEEFFDYFDRHYKGYLESDALVAKVPRHLHEDLLDIFE